MRSNGILMPISALPSPHGFGSLGSAADVFLEFLSEAGQAYWQILPIGPIGYADSPYQSFSTFAINPYFIDLDQLVMDNLLTESEIPDEDWSGTCDRIDYGKLYESRFQLLAKAVSRLNPSGPGYLRFIQEQADWLDDYAEFMAIKQSLGMIPLKNWPKGLKLRQSDDMARMRQDRAGDIQFWKQLQFLAFSQWQLFKQRADARGIALIGDVPIYVSSDSADLWANPELFQTDSELNLVSVAGCPPDFFSPTGQLWGNPLYAWDAHRSEGYRWWLRRLSHAASLHDSLRIDHFRGFASYYAIPAGQLTAERGTWETGPGLDLVRTIQRELPDIHLIAEDLGVITDDVRELLDASGYPGMKVLQFAFGNRDGNEYLPYNYERNTVVYTGTHDNNTTAGWAETAPADEYLFACEYLDVRDPHEFVERFVRAAMSSPADTCIIPIQDFLELDGHARINLPGTTDGNWRWRVRAKDLTRDLAARIRALTILYGRAKRQPKDPDSSSRHV